MRYSKEQGKNLITENSGFSIVELVVVVSILAIAAVPLIKSMTMSSRVNAKAQSIQNATSLGEKVMEEIKSLSIEEIMAKYGPTGTDEITVNTDDYVITMPNRKATQGEEFTVKVTIDKSNYSLNDALGSDDGENVKSANTVKLPRIEEIDTLSQAVLTSDKEFNRYDRAALGYFNERVREGDPAATITKKTINIEKSKVDGLTGGITGTTVKASVVYEDDAHNEYARDLYTGTFIQQDGAEGLDSNIYIFYKKSSASEIPSTVTEEINITDKFAYTSSVDPPALHKSDSHRIFFVRQDSGNDGPIVNIYRKSVSVGAEGIETESTLTSHTFRYSDSVASLQDWYTDSGTDIELITNVIAGGAKRIYKEEARIRVYDITVELYDKNGDLVTSLNSADSVSDDL